MMEVQKAKGMRRLHRPSGFLEYLSPERVRERFVRFPLSSWQNVRAVGIAQHQEGVFSEHEAANGGDVGQRRRLVTQIGRNLEWQCARPTDRFFRRVWRIGRKKDR
jgi:hypothetical protein